MSESRHPAGGEPTSRRRQRSRSRSRSRSSSLERPAGAGAIPSAAQAAEPAPSARRRRRASSTAAEAAIASEAGAAEGAEEAEEDDSDWGASNSDGDDGPEPIDLDAPDGAAQLFSALMRSVVGDATIEGMGAAQMHAVLAALQEQGLVAQDDEGNIVLMGGDDEEDEEEAGNAAAVRAARAAARARLAGDDDGGEEGEDDEEEDEEDDEEEEEEEDDHAHAYYRDVGARAAPDSPLPPEMDPEALGAFAAYAHLERGRYPSNLLSSFTRFQRDYSASTFASSAAHHRAHMASQYIPTACTARDEFGGRAFCGKFSSSASGPSRFASATQDGLIHLYEGDSWRLYKQIEARDVGWSIVDVDFSADARFVIYSSWSHSVHLINAHGQFELHEALDFAPGAQFHCAMFGIRFSPNESREILAGLNNGIVILYDVERKRKIWSARGHDDDINSVCWLDDSGNLFATGSDDASIRIWDRRLLAQNADDSGSGSARSPVSPLSRHATPVGGFLGHLHGLTCVSALPDGAARYMLSNSKDQSMKLWDLRNINSAAQVAAGADQRASQRRVLDYRWQRLSRRDVQAQAQAAAAQGEEEGESNARNDRSVVTMTGHTVAQTLIRCDFSPQHSTGFRYAVSGSADGSIYVYDILSGRVAKRIPGHHSIVRDVAWSDDDVIVSASWDHSVRRHALHKERLHDNSARQQGQAAAMPLRRRRARREEDDDAE